MQRKIPLRMCVGCREMKPKRELVRVVLNKNGEVTLDTGGKALGRGAYICRSTPCLERAVKSRALERTFSRKIDSDIYEGLRKAVEDARAADTEADACE